VLGYGEITSVLAWPTAHGPWACKRLRVFESPERVEAYRARFGEYVAALDARGVVVQDSRLELVPAATGGFTVYIVQPMIEPSALGPAVLRAATHQDGRALLARLVDRIVAVSSPTVGFDAQLSNWALVDGELVYFDVSTPLLRDEHGADLLDTELFVESLPAFLRPIVRRLFVASILDQFFSSRAIALDVIANLYKEGLGPWVPVAIDVANDRVAGDGVRPITIDEAQRYYRRDARLWGMLQAMRRLDRAWQRGLRRRPYTFLLPGRINRRLSAAR
jgi:hypothetical protein